MPPSTDLQFPVLIGDIGGTNARFQIIEEAGADPERFEPVRTTDYSCPEDAVAKSVLANSKTQPKSAILAAAGPITNDGLDLTNCHWNIVPSAFLNLGSLNKLILMNDFEAQALSLPLLTKQDGEIIGTASAKTEVENTKVVLGPGTGLGVALLVRAGNKWIPVAGEGGHVDLGPRTQRETKIWEQLETVKGRISAEQVVCGNGLINLYRACCAVDGQKANLASAAEISAAAMGKENQQADEALSLFCITLGRIAGDLAITSTARGGVYIAGGIAQKILPFLKKSGFRQAFLDKAPHRELMESITTTVVTHPLPALLGLAAYANSPDSYAVDVDHRCWAR